MALSIRLTRGGLPLRLQGGHVVVETALPPSPPPRSLLLVTGAHLSPVSFCRWRCGSGRLENLARPVRLRSSRRSAKSASLARHFDVARGVPNWLCLSRYGRSELLTSL